MNMEKLKPIPKQIRAAILRHAQKVISHSNALFVSYFTTLSRELVMVTVALRKRKDEWYMKQVAVHGLHSKDCYVRDMEFYYMAGYQVSFHSEHPAFRKRTFEDGVWYSMPDKYFNPSCYCVNPSFPIQKIPAFRYSQCDKIFGKEILAYLRIYEEYPEAEYLIKMGLTDYAMRKTLLRECRKDKAFRKWLYQHSNEIRRQMYDTRVILTAYKEKKPMMEIHDYIEMVKEATKYGVPQAIKTLFPKEERKQLYLYISHFKHSLQYYTDYLNACIALGVPIEEEQFRYPKDLERAHDLRTAEYARMREAAKEAERAEERQLFESIATKYAPLEKNRRCAYLVLLAKSPYELKTEGDALHHCVGRMGYDKKMLQEESLIFFVRRLDAPEVPFVTVEYSLAKKSILQCYGDHNGRPPEEVMAFLTTKWLPHTKRQMKKLCA